MCQYLSFLTNKEGKVWVGYLNSHSGVAAAYNLAPGTYREAEWTGEDEHSLGVRVEDGENENEYRAAILAKYPWRVDLVKSIVRGEAMDPETDLKAVRLYSNGVLHSEVEPAVTFSDGGRMWYKHGLIFRQDGPSLENVPSWRIAGTLIPASMRPIFNNPDGRCTAWVRQSGAAAAGGLVFYRQDRVAVKWEDGSVSLVGRSPGSWDKLLRPQEAREYLREQGTEKEVLDESR